MHVPALVILPVHGAVVAILTSMRKLLIFLVLISATASYGSDWSVGIATGPFVFGDFAKRTLRIQTETGSAEQTTTLSAATRAGLAVDLERSFSERFAMRVEGAFTRAPLVIKGNDDDGVSLNAGDVDIATLGLPLVYRINPRGTFRFNVHAGPSYAAYRINRRDNASSSIRLFRGTRASWGVAFGGGVDWHLSDRFAIEARLTDIATESPFRESEMSAIGRTEFPRPHNVHTMIGVRFGF